jgi:hypothetical protein
VLIKKLLYLKFKKDNPTFQLRINNVILSPQQNISFGKNSEINITCASINSRPVVNLKIFDYKTNLSLPTTKTTATNPFIYCDSKQVCLSTLVATLTVGFASINKIKQIGCSASNVTSPFELYTSNVYNLNFDGIFH